MSLPLDCKILVVDDFESMRRIIKQVLLDLGFTDVTLAEDGATALTLLESDDFGFLITDQSMPQMEGIDLVKAVRADSRLQHIPVLMISADAKKQHIIEAIESGVNDYIVKPFTAETLKGKIARIFRPPGG